MKNSIQQSLLLFDYQRFFMAALITAAVGFIVYSTLFGVLW